MSAERLAGEATPQGTRRGAEAFDAGARTLGRTGLTVSPVGFGGYRVRDDSPLHRRALADALRGGVNLIDTSTNYTDGRSEALIGTVLSHLVQAGEIRREQVVLVSKVGYVQGSNLQRVCERAQPYPEMVSLGPGHEGAHCIHPDFIAEQLHESLERLGVAKLDVLLLHNPEYALADAAAAGLSRGEALARYEDRLRRAFERLEQLCRDGLIGWYGISSNGFVEDPSDPRANALHRAVQIAVEVGGAEHRFAVAQMPMNLFELGAVLPGSTKDEPSEPTALQTALEHDLGVLINRPLNAFVRRGGGARLVRLAQGGEEPDPTQIDLQQSLAAVRKLEAAWATSLGKQILVDEDGQDAVDLFRWGQELSANLEQIADLAQWQQVRHQVIAPQLAQASSALLSALSGSMREQFVQWWTRYGTALHEVFAAVEASLRGRRQDLAHRVAQALDPHLPEPWRALPLSRKAVLTLLSSPVSSVLVGMRQPAYVHDIVALREHPIRLLSAATGPVDFEDLCASIAQIEV